MLKNLVIVLAAIPSTGFASGNRSASFLDQETGTSITIELQSNHPYLAEYRRKLIIKRGNLETTKDLVGDTGGYTATNVYRCADNSILLDGYLDTTLVDTSTGKAGPGNCIGARIYIGLFDGGGSKPWMFFPASERPETVLTMRGG